MHAAWAEGGAIRGLAAVIKPRRSYSHCANRSYMVPEAHHATMHAACVKGGAIQGLTRAINQSKSYNHLANRTYKVPEVQHIVMRAARLQAERSKGSPLYQA